MRFIDQNLIENESIIYNSRVHYFVYEESLLWGLTFLLIVTLSLIYSNALIYLGMMFSFIAAIYAFVDAFIQRHFTEISITNQRLIVKRGLIKRDVFEIPLNRIESVNINQNIIGRFLDYGSIDVKGVGTGLDNLSMIDKPFFLRKVLYNNINHQA